MIEIKEIKEVTQGNLRAFVTVNIDGVVIHDFRVVQQPGQRAWVSVPQTYWKDAAGKIHYKNLVELPTEMKKTISEKILTVWNN